MARRAILPSICALGLLATPSGAEAASPVPTVLVLPFEAPASAHRDLGFGVELGVFGALRDMGGVQIVHPKIRAAVIRRHGERTKSWSRGRRRQALAQYVGATWTLEGRITDTQIVLRFAAASGATVKTATVSAKNLEAVIGALPEQLLGLVEQADPRKRAFAGPVSPKTNDPGALARLATCYRMLNAQSIGILKPALLNEGRVRQAANRCRAALRRAPGLAEAEAGLAMVEALQGDADAAKARLTRIKDHSSFLPYYWIAKFWVLAKFYTPAHAIEALKAAIAAHPGFLLGRGYLGDSQSAVGRYAAAQTTFEAYLEAVPNQPFVMTRIGHELARLGRHDEAVAITQRALDIDPSNAEAQLELGSRLIDAGKLEAAIERLSPLAAQPTSRGEVHLRLGYAQFTTGRLDEAVESFRTAHERANHPTEWRTRGRAQYDLAKTYARQKRPNYALTALSRAIDEGFQSPGTFSKDADFEDLREDPRFVALLKRKPRPPEIPARWESPFLLGARGTAKDAAKQTLRPGRRAPVSF